MRYATFQHSDVDAIQNIFRVCEKCQRQEWGWVSTVVFFVVGLEKPIDL